MWRTVSFVERIEVEFSGSLFNQAMTLADVDNDKFNELVVGSVDGDLAVYKGPVPTPWRKCSDLGMITCIGVGNIYNTGKNHLVCLTAEGWCYIFNIKPDASVEPGKDVDEDSDKTLKAAFIQHLPANGKVMLIADVDGDGQTELVVGYSDRVVRSFRWLPRQEGDSDSIGKLIQVDKWQLLRQIGSLTVNCTGEGKPELLVAQPGGTYVTLLHGIHMEPPSDISQTLGELSCDDAVPPNIVYDALGSARTRNSSISTEIIGGISRGTKAQTGAAAFYALCTLDGTLMLVEKGQVLWSLQVDHQLFSIHKLDVTGNGTEEVVCCSWDGQTYIVNHSREVVRYQFEENVAAFSAGFYSISGQENAPCFVYATFNNRIYIYYNIKLPHVESTNLIEVMDGIEETHKLLTKLNSNAAGSSQLRELYHWVLYGWHSKT